MADSIMLQIIAADGGILESAQSADRVELIWQGQYQPGLQLQVAAEGPCYLWIQLDKAMAEVLLYLKNGTLRYQIPFGDERQAYSPESFSGDTHRISARRATVEEIGVRQNLALNPLDQRFDDGCYPHCTANAETRGEAVFAARNAIDGVRENTCHGQWPYQSWGEDENPQAEIQVDFGREVMIDEIVLYLRADFPHDNWWTQVTFTFSDGFSMEASLQKTAEGQSIAVEPRHVQWVKMGRLVRSGEESPFPALTQWEIYGTNLLI